LFERFSYKHIKIPEVVDCFRVWTYRSHLN